MKIGSCLFALVLVGGSAVAVAGDNLIPVNTQVPGVVPTLVNGVPYVGGFSNRDVVTVYDNTVGTFASTGSTPRWNMADDVQFVSTPAGYYQATDPALGAAGPFPTGNIKTDQFAIGFVYNGGDSLGNPLPPVQVTVALWDTNMVTSTENPKNTTANFIGAFNATFSTLPAQTGNVIFTTALFGITDSNGDPVSYFIPNDRLMVSYTYHQESVLGSGTFDAVATVYTGGFAIGTAATNGEGRFGPTLGGSGAVYSRDANADGNHNVGELRFFAQPTNANFYLQITGQCAVDFDQNGFPNGDDFDAYVAAFEAGADLSADFNGDGFVNGDDFDAFSAAFEKGC